MAIPDYQACMLPLLRFAADGNEHLVRDAVSFLAKQFALSETELSEFLPSGSALVFHNRVAWARSYMKKAGLLDSPKRGVLTDSFQTI
jgi:restriction system protein